jgi:triphosphoribosyl-dephospho-CoA synthase
MRIPAPTAHEHAGSAPDLAALLAAVAVQALIEEAQLTPKPALVDRRGSGAHRDLDLSRMLRIGARRARSTTVRRVAQRTRRTRPGG